MFIVPSHASFDAELSVKNHRPPRVADDRLALPFDYRYIQGKKKAIYTFDNM
jgi:hypothetical protein